MAKKILEDNEVLVAAAAEPEVLAGVEETQSEPEAVQIETPVVEPKQEVLAGEGSDEETIGDRKKSEHLRLRLLGYI